MPLVKEAFIHKSFYTLDRRALDGLVKRDFIRVLSHDKLISARMVRNFGKTAKDSAYATLKSVAEPGVEITDDVISLYESSQRAYCEEASNLFAKTNGVAILPKSGGSDVELPLKRATAHVWWPTAMRMFGGTDRVVIFRIEEAEEYRPSNLDAPATPERVVGYSVGALETLAPEIASFVGRIEAKAMANDQVVAQMTVLGGMLRPEAARKERMALKAEMYGGSFGEWA